VTICVARPETANSKNLLSRGSRQSVTVSTTFTHFRFMYECCQELDAFLIREVFIEFRKVNDLVQFSCRGGGNQQATLSHGTI